MSMLASSVLPLGSEWLLVVLIGNGLDIYGVTLSATIGNTLGACTTYAIGYFGSDFFAKRVLKLKPEKQKRAEELYNKYGAFSLIMSWLPVIGDPICFVSGVARYSFVRFFILVMTGKGARYVFLAYLASQAI